VEFPPKDLQAVLDLATRMKNLYIQTMNWDLEFKTGPG
jgi:hypothetical protein